MRESADGINRLTAASTRSLRKKSDWTQEEAALERELADELAGPLVQVRGVGPAHVLAARAAARFLVTPRARGELPRVSAAKALDRERLHVPVVGAGIRGRNPDSRDV